MGDIPETIFRPSKGAFGRLLLTFVLAAGVGVGFDTVLVWILEIEYVRKGKITNKIALFFDSKDWSVIRWVSSMYLLEISKKQRNIK